MAEGQAAPARPDSSQPITMAQAAAKLDSRYGASVSPADLASSAPQGAASGGTDTPDQPAPGDDEVPHPDEANTPKTPEGNVDQPLDEDETDGEAEAEDEAAEEEPEDDYIEDENGEKVPVKDALHAFKRFKDLQARTTRKEQALAEERKSLDSVREQLDQHYRQQFTALHQERQDYVQERQRYAAFMDAMAGGLDSEAQRWAQLDWDRLEAEDPIEAGKQWRAFQRHQEHRRHVEAERERVTQQQRAEMEQRLNHARANLEHHVASRYAEVLDPAKGQTLVRDMLSTARDIGYGPDEIQATLDTRGFDLWFKATMWDRLQREQTKATQARRPEEAGKIRVVRAAAPRPRPARVEQAALGGAWSAFNNSRSVADAMRVMEARQKYNGAAARR